MSSSSAASAPAATTPLAGPIAGPIVSADVRTVVLLLATAWAALLVYYFIGIDEGAMSVFGHSAVVHEFFHDGRHFLGFPCH